MHRSSFSYSIFIRATPNTLWAALLDPEIEKRCWPGLQFESDWKTGAPWRMVSPDGLAANGGDVLESEPPHRLVLAWCDYLIPERFAEGYSRAVIELVPIEIATKLTVTHSMDRPRSALIAAASDSWPRVLSNFKSLIETGKIALPFS